MELNMETIGNRIRSRRNDMNLTQTDIYEQCGIASGVLSRIENGKNVPSIISFYKLAEALNCDINWLATGSSTYLQNDYTEDNEKLFLDRFRQLNKDNQEEIIEIMEMKIKRMEMKNTLAFANKIHHKLIENDPNFYSSKNIHSSKKNKKRSY